MQKNSQLMKRAEKETDVPGTLMTESERKKLLAERCRCEEEEGM